MADYVNTPVPRTPEQIAERVKSIDSMSDFFGAERSRLLSALSYEDAKRLALLPDGDTSAGWGPALLRTLKDVRADSASYLNFAWEKANDCRGLSASRSLDHFRGLLWLHGPDGEALLERKEFGDGFAYYGKPALVLVSEFFGVDWKKLDNGRWRCSEIGPCLTAEAALADPFGVNYPDDPEDA